MLNNIIAIQSIIRGFLLRKKITIPSSYYQTKKWRKNRKWYIDGKHNECEIYQRSLVERITQYNCEKTFIRIELQSNNLIESKFPNKQDNGYEFTENFDGCFSHNTKKYYVNLKFVCEDGGAQTRTLREVYHFINAQIKYILQYRQNNIYFINIIDGITFYKNKKKFDFLYVKNSYTKENGKIFIGDMYEFQIWWNSNRNSVI